MRVFQPLVALPLAKLLLHLATYRGYGMFRDEFYYVACSQNLAFGYVDQPPLALALLAAQRSIFGDSLFAIRLLPAILGALTVLVVGLIAREFGGGRFAQGLAMLAVGADFLFVFHYFSMNSIDVLVWALAALVLAKLANGDSPRLWLVLGVLLGLGLQNKISVLWLGLGLTIGLVATGMRTWLATRWPWLAGAISMALFAPHVLWQIINDWPTGNFIRNATGEKMVEVAPLEFVAGQLGILTPVLAPVWLAGLAWLLFFRAGESYRVLAWIYLAVFALLMLSGSSRAGYLGAAYTWLLAAGAVAWESWLTEGRWRWLSQSRARWLRAAATLLVVAGCAVGIPFSLPILPVETYIDYAEAMSVGPTTAERKELADLPQHYADMFGWRELVEEVAGVWESLPEEERRQAAIFTYNYGNSGAIDYLGRDRGLPRSISGHNNYWLWGPGKSSGETVIVVGGGREGHERRYASVEHAATVRCRYCMPYENDKPIWVLRGPHEPLTEIWPELKHYD